MRSRRSISGLSVLVLIAALMAGFGTPAPAIGATHLRVCGRVNAYVEPTVLLPGTLTVGLTTLLIKAGTDLPSQVEVDANLCFDLELGAAGRITDSLVTANVTSSLEICGVISAYAEADATSTGELRIGNGDLVLAAGSDLPAAVRLGADLCLDLTLNGFGQVSRGNAQANATSTVEVCGRVSAFAAATQTADGNLTIDSVPRSIAAGTTLSPAVRVGAFLRLRLTLDAFGRMADDAVLAAGASLAAVCGSTQASPDPSDSVSPSASANPSASPQPSDGTVSPGPSGGDGGGTAGTGSSASPSTGAGSPGGAAAEEEGCSPVDGAAAGAPTADAGGPIPDTASLGRAGRVIGLMALPLLMLMALVIGYVAIQNRRNAMDRGMAGDRGIGEAAP